MKGRKTLETLVKLISLLLCCSGAAAVLSAQNMNRLPVPGKVTMLGFGIDLCIPCRELAQTVNNLEDRYGEEVAVVYIDKWKHPETARKFNVHLVPTQLFFDKNGREVYRHEDVMSEVEIIRWIDQLSGNQEDQ